MFAKLFIVFVACLSIVLAVPVPEANPEAKPEAKPEPKPEPLVVSAYSAGLPLVNTYSAYHGYPLTYSAHVGHGSILSPVVVDGLGSAVVV